MAKGLLLKGDLDLELVLLCKDKPTIGLLERVSDNLIAQIQVRRGIKAGTFWIVFFVFCFFVFFHAFCQNIVVLCL